MLKLNPSLSHRFNTLLNQRHASIIRPQPTKNTPAVKSHSLAKTAVLLVGLSGYLMSASVAAETFYKWIDKDGSTHYTQTPPTKKGAKATKKVFIDDMAPASPTPAPNAANANNPNGQPATNQTSNMDSNQLATAANNGSVPTAQTTSNSGIIPITPPPAGGLITPDQSQIRPAFSEPAR